MSDLQPITGKLSLPQEQIEELRKPTLPQFIEDRQGPGGSRLSYVETGYVIAQLNKIFGHIWSFEVIREGTAANQVWVLGRLKVMLSDGTVLTKEQYGSADIKMKKNTDVPVSLGDDYKGAASDAMKKCASLLGLASDVYHPNFYKTVQQLKAQAAKPKPVEPSIMMHDEQDDRSFGEHYAQDIKDE
jgi:recombination DNA repair RAD52 pathway protein